MLSVCLVCVRARFWLSTENHIYLRDHIYLTLYLICSLDASPRDLAIMRQEGAVVKEMEAAAIAWVVCLPDDVDVFGNTFLLGILFMFICIRVLLDNKLCLGVRSAGNSFSSP